MDAVLDPHAGDRKVRTIAELDDKSSGRPGTGRSRHSGYGFWMIGRRRFTAGANPLAQTSHRWGVGWMDSEEDSDRKMLRGVWGTRIRQGLILLCLAAAVASLVSAYFAHIPIREPGPFSPQMPYVPVQFSFTTSFVVYLLAVILSFLGVLGAWKATKASWRIFKAPIVRIDLTKRWTLAVLVVLEAAVLVSALRSESKQQSVVAAFLSAAIASVGVILLVWEIPRLRIARPGIFPRRVLPLITLLAAVLLLLGALVEFIPQEQRLVIIGPLVAVTIAAGVIMVLWRVPKRQVAHLSVDEKERLQLENAARQTLAQTLGGLFVLLGLAFTWQTVLSSRQSLDVAQEGQITDRFAKAIGQIGSAALQIRLGGIYALERIARDSQRDHWPVMEVLTAFVRERAPRKFEGTPRGRTPLDIQAIINVLGRRTQTYEVSEQRLDLSGTDLTFAHLEGHFERAIFRDANLSRANLDGARLSGADLSSANLIGAGLNYADLSGAVLIGADLRGANLYGAVLSKADLRGARLGGADLNGANLVGAVLMDADLSGTVLIDANLSGARLDRAVLSRDNLSGANLSGARLSGANLDGARLGRAVLRGANLYGARLSGAFLIDADLSGAVLIDANLSGARLGGAVLSKADLSRADLRGADLSGADLSGANLFGATMPDGSKHD